LKQTQNDELIDFNSLKTAIELIGVTDHQKKCLLDHLRTDLFSKRNTAKQSDILLSIASIAFKLKTIDPLGFYKIIQSIKNIFLLKP